VTRTRALLRKELVDLRQNPGVFVPAFLTGILSILLPFFVAIIIPWAFGEPLADSNDLQLAVEFARVEPLLRALDPEAAMQAWVFQQFLILLVLAPVAGAMAVAASSVIGEKQARTLEPLLATPITTFELLAAKVLGALAPAVALALASFAIYLLCVAAFAEPGVVRTLLTLRPVSVVLVLGPLASLTALQMAVCVSSRVNDVRSAQQIGALLILPIAGMLIAQVMGTLVLTVRLVFLISLGLALLNVGLMRIGIALFDRETILTRWK
jgi:ABC-2 type transport system permease protein